MHSTEVLVATLQPDAGVISADGNPAAKALQEIYSGASKAAGFRGAFSGPQIENQQGVASFVRECTSLKWESAEARLKFTQSEDFVNVLRPAILQYIDGASIQQYDVVFNASPEPVITSGVTEVLINAYDVEAVSTESQRSAIVGEFLAFVEVVKPVATSLGGTGAVYGWADGEHEKEGNKVKVLVALVGWPSVETHIKFSGLDEVKPNFALLKTQPKPRQAFHCKATGV
ncbi:hypothetical protein P152DRAFT_477694 [Eremomyces bilateralis CBS 781.70]|uniref:Uncharacterized protein n=1 Tax=Eremomyces bilateralis CBS 781.70 TaxID=1392243 RepID=A0A6G1FQM3_9PEZI|nr:uncharacterized protein P152DRAFT_477694 [Eremomyces bilateralis CBS 781.70]KAF1807989.1 hypothetical protein P152DRAFT_477694 [Eremomyces bilateralis CBS 781.70]